VRSRAIRMVPVTSRKMMKMLMILSRERSNHTIIWTDEGRETEREEILVLLETKSRQWLDPWRNLFFPKH